MTENNGLCILSDDVPGLELILVECWAEACCVQLILILDISSALVLEVSKNMDIKKLTNTEARHLIFPWRVNCC